MTRVLPSAGEIRSTLWPLDFFVRYAYGRREGEVYLDTHARRFHQTLVELADLPAGARVLELGAVPYYMTVLLERVLEARVTPVSFYEVDSAAVPVHEVRDTVTGERFTFPYRPLNVERDPFPFAAASFDAVICCEILEHLLINPSHTLYESHRVLAPGGILLISTPNVARWENVLKLAAGRNIYDHYHGNGVYGRHNREYTISEVTLLVEACGYQVERASTRDVYPPALTEGHRPPGEHRDDTIFVRARAHGEARLACPDDLYVLTDQYRNVLRPAIHMGIDDVGQLGAGWYGVESDAGRRCRWTGASATAFLRPAGDVSRLDIELCGHHPDLTTRPAQVVVSVSNNPIGHIAIGTYGWQIASLPVAPELSGIMEVVLAVDRTWSPRTTGGDDTRDLGVRVSRMALT